MYKITVTKFTHGVNYQMFKTTRPGDRSEVK